MSRTKKFLGGVGFGYANQVLVTVVGLWLTPFLLRHIEPQGYGLWLVGMQFMAYLMLLDFGVVALLPRETALMAGRGGDDGGNAREDLAALVGQAARLTMWQTPFVALGAVALWFMIPTEWEPLRRPLGLVLAVFVVMFPLRIFHAVLQGLQDFAFIGKTQICVWLTSNAVMVALVLADYGLLALALGGIVAQVLTAPVLFYRLRTRFPDALPGRLPALPWNVARGLLTKGGWISISQISQAILVGTDIFIIGKFFGPAAVVPYVCTGKLISVLANQPQLFILAAGPGLSEMKVREPLHRVSQVCVALTHAMLIMSGAIACLVLTVNRGFINWWVGAEQYGGFWLTVLILTNMLLRHWKLTAGYTILFFGYDRHLAITALLDGLVTLAGMAVGGWLFGTLGVALGGLSGVCLISLPRNLTVLARETGTTVGGLMGSLWPWLWRFLILIVMAGMVARVWVPEGFVSIAATAVVTSAIYLVVMLPAMLRTSLSTYLPQRLSALLMRIFSVPQPSNPA
ncbi:MAG TPA: oligosaccharide flippase family protein [Pyrinomonadaceae bacterium]|jgi:O-antigen/teichoic acid export membrane protein